jgi:integrase
MTLRDLLVDRIAPLRQYCERTIEMYGQTLDRLRDFLGHEPTLDDLDDLIASKWIRWRATTPHGLKRPVSPASVAKDSAHFRTMWTWCAKKRLKKSDGTEVEFPDYQRPRVPKPRPRAYTAEDLTKLLVYAKRRRGLVAGVPAAWYWMTKLLAMYQTGERIGAVLELRWGEVDLDRCTLTFLAHTTQRPPRDDHAADLGSASHTHGTTERPARRSRVAVAGRSQTPEHVREPQGAVQDGWRGLPGLPLDSQKHSVISETCRHLSTRAAWPLERGDGGAALLR